MAVSRQMSTAVSRNVPAAVAGPFLRTRVRASGDAQRQQAQLALQGGRAPQEDPADAGRSEGRAGAMLREVFDGHNYLGHNYIGTGRRDASGGVPEPSATHSLVEDVPLTGLSPTDIIIVIIMI